MRICAVTLREFPSNELLDYLVCQNATVKLSQKADLQQLVPAPTPNVEAGGS